MTSRTRQFDPRTPRPVRVDSLDGLIVATTIIATAIRTTAQTYRDPIAHAVGLVVLR